MDVAKACASAVDIGPRGTVEPTNAAEMQFSFCDKAFVVKGLSVTVKVSGVLAARFTLATQLKGMAVMAAPQMFGVIDVTGQARFGVNTSDNNMLPE